MSVEVSYKKQSLLGVIFILIILVVVEVGIKSYELVYPPCEFMTADVFNEMDFGVKRSMCLDSIYLTATTSPITLYPPNQNFDTIDINSQGFRGSEFSIIKPDETYRIFFVGGSTTFGFGASDNEKTIPGYFEKEFNITEKNIEVINAGIGAAWSFSEEYLIQNYLIKYDPDLVIVYDGANDSRYRIISDQGKNNFSIGEYIPNFYRTPYFLNDFVFKFGFSDEKNNQLDVNRVESVSSLWNQRMQNICDSGMKNDFDVAIILQPMLAMENRDLFGDEEIFYKNHINTHGENAIKIYEKMKESLKTLENCSITYDMTSIFQDTQKPIYWDDVHITEEGNRIVAIELSNMLESIID